MNTGDCEGSVTHGKPTSLGRPRADIAGGHDSRYRRLKIAWRPFQRPTFVLATRRPRNDEALLIQQDFRRQPICMWTCSDEYEQAGAVQVRRLAAAVIPNSDAANILVAMDTRDFRMRHDLDLGMLQYSIA